MSRRNPRSTRVLRDTDPFRARLQRRFHRYFETLESRILLEGATFVHPGVLNTAADFSRMAAKVAAQSQPWLADWNALTSQGYAQLGASPRPLQTVVRGGTGQNFAQMYIDIERAYDTALEWKVTGNTAYADQTVTFLNAWASTNTTLTGDADRFLASGIYGFQWANIAEMMRTYSGWAAADQTQFQNYLVNVYYPLQQSFLYGWNGGQPENGAYPTNYWANWDLCNIAGEMAIGVFCDRHDIYEQALNYIYNGGSNGAFDKAIYYIHAGNLGQGQEEGRDQGHSNLDFAMLGEICQTAWNQGDDLFSYHNNEVLAGVEYLAKYNLGNDVPFESYNWFYGAPGVWQGDQLQTTVSNGSRGQLRPIFELFYNHYVNIEGLSAPYTAQALAITRPEGDNGNGDEYSWGTLLFALDPITTVQPPQDLVGYEKGAGNIQLNFWGGANDNTYNIYRATSSTGPFTKVASGITSFTYTDTNLPAGTYYYYVTGLSGATETAASNVVTATASTLLVDQLKFDESNGATASDSVGSLVGTLNGGASFVAGKSGNAVSLDGSTGYVSLPAGAISNLSDFTIATWVYLNSAQTWARIFDFGDGRGDWMFLTARNGTGVPEFATNTINNNLNVQSVTGTSAIPTNQWVHIAVTFSNRLATLYVNGIAVGSNANMDFPPYEINGGMPNTWIGRSQFSSDPYLNGKIDDFRIYRSAMPAGQLYTLATGNPPPTVPTAPASLTATAIPGNQINLSWASVSGAPSYSVYRSTTSGGPYVPIATLLSGTTYSDTGLTAGTMYYYVVDAANIGGEGTFSPEASVVALPPLAGIPTSLTAKGISATSNGLSWTAAANAATYNVYRSTTSGGPYTLRASGITSTTFNDTGLTSGTTYYYVVSAVNLSGESATSNEASATPSALFLQLKFDETTGTIAQDTSGNGDNGTLVNAPVWDAGKVNGAVHFNSASSQYVSLPTGIVSSLSTITIAAWVRLDSISNWMRIFDFGSGTNTYMFITPANGANGRVRFAITTSSTAGEQQITGPSALPIGTWVHVAVTLAGSLGILYVNGAEVGRNSSMTLNPTSLGNTTQDWIGRSQWSGDPYFNGRIDDFRIYSQALSPAQILALAATAVPSAPTGFTVSSSTPNQIDLAWSAVPSATGYNILRSTTSGGPYTTIATHVTSAYYHDTALTVNPATGTPYYYVITAEDAGGDSTYSIENSATALPPVPAAITDLSALPGTNGAIVLTWSAIPNAGTYTIRRASSAAGPYTAIATGVTTNSYTDTGLSDGNIYYYLVNVVNAAGTSDDSNGDSATPTDLKLRYRFDETSGTTANDSSGHFLNGTLTNSPTLAASGKFNTAISLNGSNQYIQLPAGIVSSLTAITISAWVNLNSVSNWARLFDFGTGTSDYMFLAPRSGSGSVRFAITISGNTAEQQINGTAALPTGAWVHVAVTLSGSTGILYVNGAQVGINNAMTLNPSSLGNTTLNYIGKSQFNDPYLNGRVDDFRIYSRALTPSEISSLAALTQPPTAPAGLAGKPGNGEVQLSWNPLAGASGYNLYRATTTGGPYALVAGHITTTSYTDTTVSDGTPYYYTLRAYNILDEGAASAEVAATPNTPALFTISNFNDSGTGSLRQAILDANSLGGTFLLQFASGLAGTLTLASPLPALTATITLRANTPGSVVIMGSGTLLTINAGASATLQNLTFSGGTLLNNGTLQILGNCLLDLLDGNGTVTIGTVTATASFALAAIYGATSSQSALTINPGSTLDIADQTFLIHYAPGADPASSILSQFQAGAILSSTAAANTHLAVGISDNTAASELSLTCGLLGDANLDGHVDLTDLSTILNNFGAATSNWTSGNFDHAPTIDLTDLSDVLNNFGQSMSGLGFSVAAPTVTTQSSSAQLTTTSATSPTPSPTETTTSQQTTTLDVAPVPSSTTPTDSASDPTAPPPAGPTITATATTTPTSTTSVAPSGRSVARATHTPPVQSNHRTPPMRKVTIIVKPIARVHLPRGR
ncbi:MAG TPA: LamG-like jellyroll fold domain-containing protein [Phycisphaerae bacterium]|nr:LamG-like jellyroll fold domain-containing protein [Phycisphaerae bacterium]